MHPKANAKTYRFELPQKDRWINILPADPDRRALEITKVRQNATAIYDQMYIWVGERDEIMELQPNYPLRGGGATSNAFGLGITMDASVQVDSYKETTWRPRIVPIGPIWVNVWGHVYGLHLYTDTEYKGILNASDLE